MIFPTKERRLRMTGLSDIIQEIALKKMDPFTKLISEAEDSTCRADRG